MKKEEPARMLDALTQKDIIFQFGRRIKKQGSLISIAKYLLFPDRDAGFSYHPVTTHAQSETPSASSMTNPA